MGILKVKRLHPKAELPQRATEHSAGYDLCACIVNPMAIPQGGRVMIPTGIAIEIGRPDVAGFVFGRSGLGLRHGIVPANAVGVIDADYRGEIIVALTNHSTKTYWVQPGERIAQLVLLPVFTPPVEECDTLTETERGTGGFGSSGR